MKNITLSLVLSVFTILTACTITDGNSIVIGEARSPIDPSAVRIYRTPPESYEEIAMISASAGHDFKKNSSLVNSAIQRLKEEAAKLGANGVLLSGVRERDKPVVTTSYGSASGGNGSYVTGNTTSVSRGDSNTRIQGLAIFTASIKK
ncbi:hypothetical protein [uncultured Pseudoteredinibacter sp.]|uniref:hypothetical protein n=1 Tax=uncultured Pseudoteredinibacter sp. TaxID=1641701 RepID=UPI00260C7240|nr:hypothetical protein [uncultured Pseudoteredinibacter sp.]